MLSLTTTVHTEKGKTMDKLKPCPFCGAPINSTNHLFGWHKEDCFFVLLEEPDQNMTEEELTEALAEAWNRRDDNEK